ncbi:hypothetical protein PQC39_gp099 [Vibrio phage Vp_R1]|uniref:Uncharacterized protein n=1 Tax=Vibrio phage Vp_R1 TaxID=2059867 RepID=A0A2H5BQ51_9CAUD|nr:hypothetical protein PQC39_gp099 [Vibrio phage Vp_R1]AUG88463.1 hypothetical protein VPR_099 [Vibrio phage Vp_R1]
MDFLGKILPYIPTSLLELLTQPITQSEVAMEIDVREVSTVTSFKFADNNGGKAKAVRVVDGAGNQCNICTSDNNYVYVQYENIDNLISALRAAKAEWYAEN